MTEPTSWEVAVTTGDGTEHTEYRNGKDAHRVAGDRSREPGTDRATVTFNGHVTTYRDGIGRDPEHDAEHVKPEPEPGSDAPEAEPGPGCKRLTIRHTHEDGTLILGTDKGDGVYEIVRQWSGGRFRYFPSIEMIGIAQSRDQLAKRGQIQMAAEALRKAGHVVTVEIDDTPRDVADVKADRAGRLDDRYDRLTGAAQRAGAEAERRFDAADHYAERFAGGQPILVGHHSERSARVAQKRIDQNMRAGIDAQHKAERIQSAAAVVGREAARRERPDVIIRRIAKLEAELRKCKRDLVGQLTYDYDADAGKYKPRLVKPSGAWLEQLTARQTFLEHQLEADRAALAEHEANGYLRLTRDKVHKGDIVSWRAVISGRPAETATVLRVNPKSVSLDRTSWPRVLDYEKITHVECPHQGTETVIKAPRKPAAERPEPEPVVVRERPERPEPVMIDARFEFFPTPNDVARRVIDAAGITYQRGLKVLEPSAGLGALTRPAAAFGAEVDSIELSGQLADKLRTAGYRVQCADFLEVAPRPDYDRVIMNPPFKDRADVRHVLHADKFLKPGGRLVAVMSAGVSFREDKLTADFRALVSERGGSIEPLPEDAFRQSGTLVRTVLVTLPATPEPEPERDHLGPVPAAMTLF